MDVKLAGAPHRLDTGIIPLFEYVDNVGDALSSIGESIGEQSNRPCPHYLGKQFSKSLKPFLTSPTGQPGEWEKSLDKGKYSFCLSFAI